MFKIFTLSELLILIFLVSLFIYTSLFFIKSYYLYKFRKKEISYFKRLTLREQIRLKECYPGRFDNIK